MPKLVNDLLFEMNGGSKSSSNSKRNNNKKKNIRKQDKFWFDLFNQDTPRLSRQGSVKSVRPPSEQNQMIKINTELQRPLNAEKPGRPRKLKSR